MKVLKYDEFINELFAKSVNRGLSGKKRLEDEFNISDVRLFNAENVYRFTKEHNLDDSIRDYRLKVMDTYDDFIKNYAKQHGTLELGFSLDDKAKMPDFEYSFPIDIKDSIIHVTYNDDYKELKITCGNNEQIDITDTNFGKYMYNSFEKYAYEHFWMESDILEENIKRNWETFEECLHDFVYKCCYDDFEYDVKHGYSLNTIDCIEIDTDLGKLKKFFFDGVSYAGHAPYVSIGGKDITDTHIGKRIITIYQQAYDDAKRDIKGKYPDYEDD